jgi:hypothetical protein
MEERKKFHADLERMNREKKKEKKKERRKEVQC